MVQTESISECTLKDLSNDIWHAYQSWNLVRDEENNIPSKYVSNRVGGASVALQNELYRVVHKTVRAQQVVEQHKVGGSKVGRLNECLFRRLREGPIKDTKWTKGRSDRNVAPSGRPTTNVIGPLHECKKVCPCTKPLPQSGIHAWIK